MQNKSAIEQRIPNIDLETHFSLIFFFDLRIKRGCIYDPELDSVLINLPQQQVKVDGFPLHPDSYMSKPFSSYLKYLDTQHILLWDDQATIAEIHIDDGSDSQSDDYIFDYTVKTMRIPAATDRLLYNDNSIVFSFINGKLYSTAFVEMIEV